MDHKAVLWWAPIRVFWDGKYRIIQKAESLSQLDSPVLTIMHKGSIYTQDNMEKQDEKTLNVKEKQKYHSEATLKWLSPSIDKGQWAFLLKMWVNIPTLSLTSSVTWVTYSLKNLVFLIHTLSNSNLYFLCVLRIKRNDLCRKPSVQFNHSVVSNSL